jgi:hypothetical protein
MVKISAATESPPCPPDSNGDRVDCELARSDEEAPEPRVTQKPRRSMSEKQLETLRKAREAKAAKKPKPEPKPEPEPQVPNPVPPAPKTATKTLKLPRKAREVKAPTTSRLPDTLTRSHTNQSLTIF